MVCGVAINSLEITLILQPGRSDVIIGPDRAHGNRLYVNSRTSHVNTEQYKNNLLDME